MFEIIGVLGFDALDLSLREIIWAYHARERNAWNHTAALIAVTAEINRDRKKRKKPYSLTDFHPYFVKPKTKKINVGIKALKYLFVEKNKEKFTEEVNKAIKEEENGSR